MKPTAFALDFDHTIARFIGGLSGFLKIFIDQEGVSESLARKVYEDVKDNLGFSVAGYANEVEKLIGRPLNRARIDEAFAAWCRSALRAYPDSIGAIERMRKVAPVAIVTAGSEAHQRTKIEIVGVPYDELHIVPPSELKVHTIKELLARHGAPVVFVDDAPAQLDAVRDGDLSEGNVITIWMKRPDEIRAQDASRHSHREVDTLAEVLAIVGEK